MCLIRAIHILSLFAFSMNALPIVESMLEMYIAEKMHLFGNGTARLRETVNKTKRLVHIQSATMIAIL